MSVLIARSQRPLSTRSAILRRSAIQRRSETNISETIKNERSKFGDQAIQTLVVDNFEAIRKLICSALKERAGIEVVGEAEDGLEALHQFDELKPNLVMLDLDLPKLNGLEVAKSIRRCSSDCKIVSLTLDIDPQVVLESSMPGQTPIWLRRMSYRNCALRCRRSFPEGDISATGFTTYRSPIRLYPKSVHEHPFDLPSEQRINSPTHQPSKCRSAPRALRIF